MTCPSVDQCEYVSKGVKPVTHVQEVDIKRLSIKLVDCPFLAHIGRDSSIVPTTITARKLDTINLTGENRSLKKSKDFTIEIKAYPPYALYK